MRVSSAGMGIVAGSLLGIAVIVLFVLLALTKYTIAGTIQVDTGAYVSPACNINVDLILASVDQDLARLTDQFQAYRSEKMTQAVARLAVEMETKLAETIAKTPATSTVAAGLSIEHVIDESLETGESAPKTVVETELMAILKEPAAADEKEEIQSRVDKYLRYALYCREMIDNCSVGNMFYRKGAEFWEEKVAALKEKGRLVYDDATVNYSTDWERYTGLGDEPVQEVSRTVRIDPAELAAAEEALGESGPAVKPAARAEKPKPPAIGKLVSTNAIAAQATELERVLKDQYQYGLGESLKLLRDKTIMSVQTDAEGAFSFKGDEIQPGDYVVYAIYDVLSAEGEPVEFMWFEPVKISLRRFAFNKATVVTLNELNQHKPTFQSVYLPGRDELYLQLMDELEKKRKSIESAP